MLVRPIGTSTTLDTRTEPPEEPPEENTGMLEYPKNAGVLEKIFTSPCGEGLSSNQTWTYGHHIVQEAFILTFNHLNFHIRGEQVSVFEHHELDPMEEFVLHKTHQMGTNRGLNIFVGAGIAAIKKEMQQLYYRRVSILVYPNKISRGDKRAALKCLTFLKQKHNVYIKGRGCANGPHQHEYTSKHNGSSPTVAIK